MQKMSRSRAGFTLIELMIVMAILALMAGLVGPNLWNKFAGAKRDTAATQINSLGAALDTYRLDIGKYPKSLDELVKDSTGKSAWDGPYIKKIPLDPWQNSYQYVFPGKNNIRGYDLYSMAADAQAGGENEDKDITNWE